MTASRAAIGVDLWRLYAAAGRVLPASWIARAVRVSPTTMSKYLASLAGYVPRRGWTPGRGWNWSVATRTGSLVVMKKTPAPKKKTAKKTQPTEVVWSNGHRFELGGVPDEEERAVLDALPGGETGMDFMGAMGMVAYGWAVCRMSDCQRVVFRKGRSRALLEGASEKKRRSHGRCVASGTFAPTLDDVTARDWMADCYSHEPA